VASLQDTIEPGPKGWLAHEVAFGASPLGGAARGTGLTLDDDGAAYVYYEGQVRGAPELGRHCGLARLPAD